MREAEVSPNLSPPCRMAQTPMQTRALATAPYKKMNIYETFSFLMENARNAALDAAAVPFNDVATLLVTLSWPQARHAYPSGRQPMLRMDGKGGRCGLPGEADRPRSSTLPCAEDLVQGERYIANGDDAETRARRGDREAVVLHGTPMTVFQDGQGSQPDRARAAADHGELGDEHALVGADQPEAPSLPAEVEGEGMTVANVTGTKGGGWKHGGYTILAGHVDGRSAVARRMRRLAERVARDTGFETFETMPSVRQEVVVAFCRTVAAADAMWASFLANGRLADKFWELTSLTRKYAELLGLDRVLKVAKATTPGEYVLSKYGERNGEGIEVVPTDQSVARPGPSGGGHSAS